MWCGLVAFLTWVWVTCVLNVWVGCGLNVWVSLGLPTVSSDELQEVLDLGERLH